jgi:hypothetical protein
LKQNIKWLAIRRYIKIIELNETEDTLTFCFTSHKPQSGDGGKATTQESNTEVEH